MNGNKFSSSTKMFALTKTLSRGYTVTRKILLNSFYFIILLQHIQYIYIAVSVSRAETENS